MENKEYFMQFDKLKENMQYTADYSVWSRLQFFSSNLQTDSFID